MVAAAYNSAAADGGRSFRVKRDFSDRGTSKAGFEQHSHSTRSMSHCIRRKISAICKAKSTMSLEVAMFGDKATTQEQRNTTLLNTAQ